MKTLYFTLILGLTFLGSLIHIDYAIAGFFFGICVSIVTDLKLNA